MKLTPCLVVGLAFMTGIQGETIMGMKGEENYMEKKIMNDLIRLLEDTPHSRLKRSRRGGENYMKRSSLCVSLESESTKCIEEAADEYMTYMMGEGDSRPDFLARKTCNFLTSAAQDCVTKLMATCKPPGGDQAFTKAKDESIKNLLEVADEMDINFDPKKCPITKEYIDRTSGYSDFILPGESVCNDRESYTEGCIKQTCKNGIWRPSLEETGCCYEGEAFPPNSIITAVIAEDGCTRTTIECRPDGNKAKMVLNVENNCPAPLVVNSLDELEGMINKIEGKLETVEGKVETVEMKLLTVDRTVDKVEEKLDALMEMLQENIAGGVQRENKNLVPDLIVPAQAPRCKEGWENIGEKCVLFAEEWTNQRFNWYDARSFCSDIGADLVEFSTDDEFTLVRKLALQRQGAFYWIGATDAMDGEGVWSWASSGKSISIHSQWWGDGEPNNVQNQDCARLHTEPGYYELMMDDWFCDRTDDPAYFKPVLPLCQKMKA